MNTYRYRYSRRIPVRILHAYHFNPVEMSGRELDDLRGLVAEAISAGTGTACRLHPTS